MTLLETIGTELQTEGLGTLGTNIFLGKLPSNSEDSIMVMHSASPQPNLVFDVYEQYIEFWTRNKSSEEGLTVMQAIRDIFHRGANYSLGDYHIFLSNMLGGIEDNDQDIEGNKLYLMRMRFIYIASEE